MEMKRKIKVNDTKTGKVKEGEVNVRAYDHFQGQLKSPHLVQKNRKKYCRKQKHKIDYKNEEK